MVMSEKEILVDKIISHITDKPFFFYDLLREFPSAPYRDILVAWGIVRERTHFARDESGHYLYPSDSDDS
jgi:hypothetical protein